MNTLPCKSCRFFDPLLRNVRGVPRPLPTGRCGKMTVYPATARDGQVYPDGATQAELGTNPLPSQVKIVDGAKVVRECVFAQKK